MLNSYPTRNIFKNIDACLTDCSEILGLMEMLEGITCPSENIKPILWCHEAAYRA